MAIGPDEFRAVLGRFASGVTVLTAHLDGRDHGMTVSAFCSASLEPPLVVACVAHEADMHGVLRSASHFGVSILAEGQEAVSRRFAELPTSDERFEGIGYSRGESGVPFLEDALAYFECRAIGHYEAGDHTIHIGEVEYAHTRQGRPLLYYRGGYAQIER
jgi:flavin reductase (DIM6/NTAB) family NADH-FMN oxidoreductase RutF